MNWERKPFLDVVTDITSGNKKFQSAEYLSDGKYPIIDQGADIIAGYTNEYAVVERTKPVILFGDHTKKIQFVDYDFCLGADGVKVLNTSDSLLPKFLYYYLQTVNLPDVGYSRHYKFLKECNIPLLPLPIQQQIADTLDKADDLRRKDQELLDKYDELAQAVFYEMFGDISINSKNWNIVQIRSIAQEVKYGTSSPAAASGSYPYLRMNNISYSGELLLDDLKYISASEKEFEKYGTRYGDLLFNRTNSKDLVGKTTIVDTETPMIIAGYLIRVRFNDQANPWYVSTFMNSTHMKKVLRNKCKSIIGMANINAQELQDFDIPLPPKELQDSFAEKLTHIKKQQSIVKKTQSKSSAYFNQCLYNYFV